ncbi:7-carboxy-7-deazaguanine synthase QueE [Marinilabiliaceae bacterium ANBcel2]|nr:7-carboxy-7-deazaguanine synthase QueE [Marinilabiliaceae bacterium ANBcel2]
MEKRTLILSQEGVFPVTGNKLNKENDSWPATGIGISGTIQGEGKLTGVPSLFIRLAGCNIRCAWELPDGTISRCDTPHSLSFNSPSVFKAKISDITKTIFANLGSLNHIVITGGEPLLQKDELKILISKLKEENKNLHITIETNGTIYDRSVAELCDLISISPKLKGSCFAISKNKCDIKRVDIKTIQAYIDSCKKNNKEFQLKFVVSKPHEENEIKEIISKLKGFSLFDIICMPLGASPKEILKTSSIALKMAIANNWRFSPREHITLFGNKTGT